MKGLKLKLNKDNLTKKIHVHTVSSVVGCIYPPSADHIIDVQCMGAFKKVPADNLVRKGTKHE